VAVTTPGATERQRLLPTPVVVLWFVALLSWASGRVIAVLNLLPLPSVTGPVGQPSSGEIDEALLGELQRITALQSLPTTFAVILAAIGLGMLYNRRGVDRLSRPAAAAVATATTTPTCRSMMPIGRAGPIVSRVSTPTAASALAIAITMAAAAAGRESRSTPRRL